MEIDPWNPTHRTDPHAFWNEVRETTPVACGIGPVTGTRFWFLTRYEDCQTVLRSPSMGKRPEGKVDDDRIPDIFKPGEPSAFDAIGFNLLDLDPPDHTRLRRLVRDGFSQRTVERLRPRVVDLADELLAAVEPDTTFDLIESVALPLPITVIAELLGLPVSDHAQFRTWTAAILGRGGGGEEAAMATAMEFVAYINDLADKRRSDPQDDLLSFLVHAEEDGDHLDHREMLAMIMLLLIAGHETTVNLIGNGMFELTRHPDEMDRLAADRTIMRSAIEELVRFHGPVESSTMRLALEDVEVGGHGFEPGDIVAPILLAANRDPAAFTDPDRLDLRRDPNRHLGFGTGIHFCLGAPLARMEAEVAFGSLFDRAPRFDLACDEADLEWTEGFFLRGASRVPLTPVP